MGSSSTSTDPLLWGCLNYVWYEHQRGVASVWYKYVPARDGKLNLDTIGSDYDTALMVYLGTPSMSPLKACNDDISMDPTWNTDSQLTMDIKAGSTYYIEIVDTGFTDIKSSLSPSSLPAAKGSLVKSDVQIESIGGNLHLNGTLSPCYDVKASSSSSTAGSVQVSPAPNCLGTKYVEGTSVSLQAVPKPTYGFLELDRPNHEQPDRLFRQSIFIRCWFQSNSLREIRADPRPDPGFTANAALTNDNTPELSWNAVSGGMTYQVQLSPTRLLHLFCRIFPREEHLSLLNCCRMGNTSGG